MPLARLSQEQRTHHLLAAWMRSPLKVGAVLPSSRALTHAMAAQVNLQREGVVIELGAGTGVVTQALLHAGIPAEQLVVIERDPKLHALLCAHFPYINNVCGDAMELQQLLLEQNVKEVGNIVSSLPLLSLPREVRHAIEAQMLELVCQHGAKLIQFTYGPTSPISTQMLKRYNVFGRRVKFVMANMPPAHVWVFKTR